jgi:hypothetical protein
VKHIRTARILYCPNCPVSATSGQLLKQVWSCPIAVADRAQRRDDLAWLRDHRNAPYRIRPVTLAEQEHLRLTGLPTRVPRRVEVMVGRAGPGERVLLHALDGALIAVTADLGGAPR